MLIYFRRGEKRRQCGSALVNIVGTKPATPMAGVGKYRQNEAVDVIGSAVCEPQKQAYAGGRYAFRNSRRFGGRYALETGADRRLVQGGDKKEPAAGAGNEK